MMEPKQLERLEQKLAEVCEGVAKLNAIVPTLCERLCRCEREIYGNGSEGLATKVKAVFLLSLGIGTVALANLLSVWLAR